MSSSPVASPDDVNVDVHIGTGTGTGAGTGDDVGPQFHHDSPRHPPPSHSLHNDEPTSAVTFKHSEEENEEEQNHLGSTVSSPSPRSSSPVIKAAPSLEEEKGQGNWLTDKLGFERTASVTEKKDGTEGILDDLDALRASSSLPSALLASTASTTFSSSSDASTASSSSEPVPTDSQVVTSFPLSSFHQFLGCESSLSDPEADSSSSSLLTLLASAAEQPEFTAEASSTQLLFASRHRQHSFDSSGPLLPTKHGMLLDDDGVAVRLDKEQERRELGEANPDTEEMEEDENMKEERKQREKELERRRLLDDVCTQLRTVDDSAGEGLKWAQEEVGKMGASRPESRLGSKLGDSSPSVSTNQAKQTAEAKNRAAVFYHEDDQAELVYNLAVCAIHFHTAYKLQMAQNEKAKKNSDAKRDEEDLDSDASLGPDPSVVDLSVYMKTVSFLQHKLDSAFHISASDSMDFRSPYLESVDTTLLYYRSLLHRHLRDFNTHPYYRLTAFKSPESYGRWFKTENEDLVTLEREIEERLQKVKEREEAKGHKGKGGKQAGNGGKKKSSFNFLCCCGSVDEDGEESKRFVSNMERRNNSHGVNKSKIDENWFEKNNLDSIKIMDAYALLLNVLIQEDSGQCPIYTTKNINETVLLYPQGPSLEVLDAFCCVFRVGPVYKYSQYTHLLYTNLNKTFAYFTALHTSVSQLLSLYSNHFQIAFTVSELNQLKTTLTEFREWSWRCLSRYSACFQGDILAFKQAILLLIKIEEAERELRRSEKKEDQQEEEKESSGTKDELEDSPTGTHRIVEDFKRAVLLAAEHSYESALDQSHVAALKAAASVLAGTEPTDPVATTLITANGTVTTTTSAVIPPPLAELRQASAADLLYDELRAFQLDSVRAGHFNDSLQALQVLKTLTKEIKADFEYDAALNDVTSSSSVLSSFKISSITGPYYLKGIFAEIQTFLTILASVDFKKHLKNRHLSFLFTNVFAIYQSMDDFYQLLERNIKTSNELPEFESVHPQFRPFVDAFLIKIKSDFDSNFIEKILAREKFLPLSSIDKYSRSVIDLFSQLYPLSEQFKSMPYTSKQVEEFASVLTLIVSSYVKHLYEDIHRTLLVEDKKKAFFGLGHVNNSPDFSFTLEPALFIRMNCLYICRKQLFDVLETIDVSKAVDMTVFNGAEALMKDEHKSKTNLLLGAQAQGGSASDLLIAQYDSSMLPPGVNDIRACQKGVMYIAEMVDTISNHFAAGLGFFLSSQFSSILYKAPVDAVWTSDQVLSELQPTIQYLRRHLDFYRENLYDFFFLKILFSLSGSIVLFLERSMVYPPKGDNRMRLMQSQLVRVLEIKQALLRYLEKDYEFPEVYMTRLMDLHLARMEFVHHILSGPADRLLVEFDNVDAKQDEAIEKLTADMQEAKRLVTKPYLSRKQIISIVEFRHEVEHAKGDDIQEFLKKYQTKKSFFSNLF